MHAVKEVDSDSESISTVHVGECRQWWPLDIWPSKHQICPGEDTNRQRCDYHVIPKKYIGGNHVTPTSTVLQIWNITRVIPVGEAKVER